MPLPDKSLTPPPKDANPPAFNVPRVVLAVVAVLVSVHAALWALGENWQVFAQAVLAFIPVRLGGGDPIPTLYGSQAWSFFTYALLHGDVYHLGSNCVWLTIFSTPVARRLGWWRYLVLLLLSTAAGAVAMLPLHWGKFLVVVGASASVSAVLAAAIPIMFAPGFRMGSGRDVNYQSLDVLRPRALLSNASAIAFAALFFGIQLLTGASMAITGTAFLEESPIAWEAHIGGFIAGLVLFYLLDRKRVSHLRIV
jgi:membrane associated rhomboid family serine protease